MTNIIRNSIATVAIIVVLVGSSIAVAQEKPWPQRVLITNDNGIADVTTQALARAFAHIAEVFLVASSEDRSSTSNLMSFIRTGKFVVERCDIGEGVRAWALDGYPADCVIFAVTGPMAGAPPDLVVSGINDGANTSDEWFASGTIGAARTAAYIGIPAIAVSGIDENNPEAIAAAVDWILRIAHSKIMQRIQPPSYLTISLPIGPPFAITGVEVVDRARGIFDGTAQLDSIATKAAKGKEVWSITIAPRGQPALDSDVTVAARGHIAVVPMRVGDTDPEMLEWLRSNSDLLPSWEPISRDR